MADLPDFLPSNVEQGALRRLRYSTDVVTTDGGYEVRNARWAEPLLTFEISFPTSKRNDDTYQAVRALYEKSLGGAYTFGFKDWADGGAVKTVRFDSPLSITGIDRNLDHIETITLVEVKE